MGRFGYRFLISFYTMFALFILAINYTGWSGAWVDLSGGEGTGYWGQQYFGFQSFMSMIGDVDDTFGQYPITTFYKYLSELANDLTFGIPRYIQNMVHPNWNALTAIGQLILDIFLSPFKFIFHIIQVVCFFVVYVINVLAVILNSLRGAYNSTFETMPNPNEYMRNIGSVIV